MTIQDVLPAVPALPPSVDRTEGDKERRLLDAGENFEPTRASLHWDKLRRVVDEFFGGSDPQRGLLHMTSYHLTEFGSSFQRGRYEFHLSGSSVRRMQWRESTTSFPLAPVALALYKQSRCDFKMTQLGLVLYYSEIDCRGTEVKVIGSGLRWSVSLVPDGKYLYVLTLSGRLRVCSGKILQNGARVAHPSISRGLPVQAAGTLQVSHGKVKYVTNISGHYRPGRRSVRNVVCWLKHNGISPHSYGIRYVRKDNQGHSYEVRCRPRSFLS